MRHSVRLFTYSLFAGVLIAIAPVNVRAQQQTQHSAHDTLDYNEEVVKNLLEKADPDVAFLARVKMMQGHLNAAIHAVGKRDLAEARQHITHPASEILPDIVSVLQQRNLKDPTPALNAILELLKSGAKEETVQALYDAIVEMGELEHSIASSKMVINRIVADTAVLLLRTAVMEYDEAFQKGKIVNIVEYHDGAAFVTEAATLILDVKYEWAQKDLSAFDQLELSLKELQTAWPSEVPPAKSVIPVAKMLGHVTNIEEQINKIRAGV